MNKLLKKNEFYVFLTIILLSLIIQMRSGQFFTPNNIVDLVVSMIVPAMLSLSAFLVIISGGIDVSFPAIASLSMYVTTELMVKLNFAGPIWVVYLIAAGIGILLGSFNGLLVVLLKLPTLIITLGTSSVFIGIMLGALKAREIADLPVTMQSFGNASLLVARNAESGLTSNLPPTVLLLGGIVLILFLLLKFTVLGRSIYAVGGDEIAARRSGFPVDKTKIFVYMLSGCIAGIAGISRVCMLQNCYPTNLLGTELNAIAAVVLGGASITAGGIGTLTGALLGTALITIMANSMILLGIPTYWQSFSTGMLILVGIGVSAYQTMRAQTRIKD